MKADKFLLYFYGLKNTDDLTGLFWRQEYEGSFYNPLVDLACLR